MDEAEGAALAPPKPPNAGAEAPKEGPDDPPPPKGEGVAGLASIDGVEDPKAKAGALCCPKAPGVAGAACD